uniref:Histidine--tRNA ligase, chloroplastic n=1 Tax=Palmaria decipiens TaxID=187399 RepID=A0A6C0W1H7_PALDE|nr:Histidine-tRNA ligase [Palmaria decipiens]QIC19482.1 Histidine-tRNA ligase [Palmaria decipiens]
MQSIRGMHDILPKDTKYWQHVYNIAMDILSQASYQEIRTPIIEDTSLFLRGIGTDTDIVSKEMYSFEDRGRRNLTLRPEGTAPVARSLIQHKLYNEQPIQKLWYMGPMFRYERPQHGRQRQFHQLGLECYGSNSPVLDAEVIYLANQIIDSLECSKYTIEINSIGSSDTRQDYEKALRRYLSTYQLDLDGESQKRLIASPLTILDSKDPQTQEILLNAPIISDFLDREALIHFEKMQDYLSSMNIPFTINNHLVRGLDYYNSTVFEIKTNLLGTQDTICGGGRYDSLTQQLGGPAIPALGWGIGIERLLLLVQDKLDLPQNSELIYLALQGYEAEKKGLSLIPIFRNYDLRYEVDLSGSSFQKQVKRAHKKNALMCVIIGEEEASLQTLTVKWLKEYRQETCSRQQFIETLKLYKKEEVIR